MCTRGRRILVAIPRPTARPPSEGGRFWFWWVVAGGYVVPICSTLGGVETVCGRVLHPADLRKRQSMQVTLPGPLVFKSPLGHAPDLQKRLTDSKSCHNVPVGFRYDARCPSTSTKRAVIARDGMICRWCTQPVVRSQEHRPDRLHFDHVIQWSHGGPSSIDNIVVSCATCNMRRSERGGNVRSPLRDLYTYSYGIYRWCEPVTIPRVLTGMGLELGMHVANESHRDPVYTIADIFRGRLAATNEGKILIEIGPPSSRGRGRAS